MKILFKFRFFHYMMWFIVGNNLYFILILKRGACRGSLLCGGPVEKRLLVRCCWKTLNSNSLDRFCAFIFFASVICSWKSLPNNPFPEFSNSAFLSFVIDFAWLELFMAPASALSRLWYDMVLLVCPATSTVCWTKFSKSSLVKSASLSGAVVELSRAYHTFDTGPMTSIFFWFF